MIYISKKEEFLIIIKPCEKTSHGAYCWKQLQEAREGWTGCGERGGGGGWHGCSITQVGAGF